MQTRRQELEHMTDAQLVRQLSRFNPLGGYSIGDDRGQLTRLQAINTILLYKSRAGAGAKKGAGL